MLSKVVKEVRGWLGTESPIVIARVLGTSPDSSSLQVGPLGRRVDKLTLLRFLAPSDHSV